MTIAIGWQQFLGAKPGEIGRANIPVSKMGWRRMKNFLDRHPLMYEYLFGTQLETHYLCILSFKENAAIWKKFSHLYSLTLFNFFRKVGYNTNTVNDLTSVLYYVKL